MVGDVAEMRAHRGIDRQNFGMRKPLAHVQQRRHRIAQPQEVAPKQIEPINEYSLTERLFENAHPRSILDLLIDRFQNRRVIVDDKIEDRIEDVVLAMCENGGQDSQRSRTFA